MPDAKDCEVAIFRMAMPGHDVIREACHGESKTQGEGNQNEKQKKQGKSEREDRTRSKKDTSCKTQTDLRKTAAFYLEPSPR